MIHDNCRRRDSGYFLKRLHPNPGHPEAGRSEGSHQPEPLNSPPATADIEPMPTSPQILRSHHELRAALIVAGKQIRRLNFGRGG